MQRLTFYTILYYIYHFVIYVCSQATLSKDTGLSRRSHRFLSKLREIVIPGRSKAPALPFPSLPFPELSTHRRHLPQSNSRPALAAPPIHSPRPSHPIPSIPSFASPVKPAWYSQSTADPANAYRTSHNLVHRDTAARLPSSKRSTVEIENVASLHSYRRGHSKTVATEESSFRHRTSCLQLPPRTEPHSQLPLETRAHPKLYTHAA